MNREDWLAHLDAAPVTVSQRGRIAAECERLGLTDRAERLAVLAELLDVDGLDTTADLTQGQGGYLVGILSAAHDRADLPTVDLAGDPGEAAADLDERQGDDGLTDHCGCCGHSRASGCGGPACPCGAGRVTLADLLGQLARFLLALTSPAAQTSTGSGPADD